MNALLRAAAKEALRLRGRVGIPRAAPVQVYDLCENLGIEVRLLELPSFEGMVAASRTATILLSALRPKGRRAFTCAHELGHWALGHGVRIDEMVDLQREETLTDVDELAADAFASHLLMPRAAVLYAISQRGLTTESMDANSWFEISQWLGVGYTTLLVHAEKALRLLSRRQATELRKVRPKSLRTTLYGQPCSDLFIVDQNWTYRPVDVEVGDVLRLPTRSSVETHLLSPTRHNEDFTFYAATAPGVGRMLIGEEQTGIYVRIQNARFTGRATYRHMPSFT